MTTHLTLSWSVSRGVNTYGYNIARLDDDTTGKRYRCNGGGYDMIGTVLAEWLGDVHQDALMAIADKAHATVQAGVGYSTRSIETRWGPQVDHNTYYGMCRYLTADGTLSHVSVDGACGQSSVETIMRAIGLRVRRDVNRRGNTTGFLILDGE